MSDFTVSLSPAQACEYLERELPNSGMSVECVDAIAKTAPDGHGFAVLVFEKYFMRNSSRASLTVTIDNFSGQTYIRTVGSGGGQSLLWRFDWGSSESFEGLVHKTLRPYLID